MNLPAIACTIAPPLFLAFVLLFVAANRNGVRR
jgi:hypothetical protein